MVALKCYRDTKASLGEGPVWDAATGRLYWVDCVAKLLLRLAPTTSAIDRWPLPHYPGSFAMRPCGGMIMAFRNELALINVEKGSHRTIEGPFDFSRERLNDGKCDRMGRFWVGSMDREGRHPVGALFRVDRDLSVTRMAEGFVVSNGIAFAPDDRVMYQTDSRRGLIYVYDFDLAAGVVENRRVFLDFAQDGSRPDGCTVDADGGLWVCEVDAGRISRFDPAGRRERSISLPVTRPASVIFGGQDLQHLYIATMSYGLSPEALREQPDAGCLFRADPSVHGLPETSFVGD